MELQSVVQNQKVLHNIPCFIDRFGLVNAPADQGFQQRCVDLDVAALEPRLNVDVLALVNSLREFRHCIVIVLHFKSIVNGDNQVITENNLGVRYQILIAVTINLVNLLLRGDGVAQLCLAQEDILFVDIIWLVGFVLWNKLQEKVKIFAIIIQTKLIRAKRYCIPNSILRLLLETRYNAQSIIDIIIILV